MLGDKLELRMPARQLLLGHKWKFLLIGLWLSAATDDAVAKHGGVRRSPRRTQTPGRCWIFTHMNKSGGSTIKAVVGKHLRRIRGSLRLYTQLLYGEGEERAKQFLSQNTTVIAGGYTEAFRPLGGGEDCKWFTLFRHPVSRVVSAYFYCKSVPSELLCGTAILKANETDIYSFAEHWGNFGLRQYALGFVNQDELLSMEVEQGRCTPECPPWYRAKLYFEGLHVDAGRHEAQPVDESDPLTVDVSMASYVEPVKNLLSTRYAAVGILEEWEKSMALFDHALELPKLSWFRSSRRRAKNQGSDEFSDERDDLLRTAWTDPKLKKYISLDLLLYDHVVGVYQQQLKDYGLVEWRFDGNLL